MAHSRCLWMLHATMIVLAGAGSAHATDATKATAPDSATSRSVDHRVPASTHYTDWPAIKSSLPADPALEARVKKIVASMTLAQKVGQMTQAEIKSITPAEVTRYYIGSVLNGGGSWPGMNKHAAIQDWLSLADRYYDASMATDAAIKVPIIWGTDAVHGDNNVLGATLFPHNIGLRSARLPPGPCAPPVSNGRSRRPWPWPRTCAGDAATRVFPARVHWYASTRVPMCAGCRGISATTT